MRASELIQTLSDLIDENGDLELVDENDKMIDLVYLADIDVANVFRIEGV